MMMIQGIEWSSMGKWYVMVWGERLVFDFTYISGFLPGLHMIRSMMSRNFRLRSKDAWLISSVPRDAGEWHRLRQHIRVRLVVLSLLSSYGQPVTCCHEPCLINNTYHVRHPGYRTCFVSDSGPRGRPVQHDRSTTCTILQGTLPRSLAPLLIQGEVSAAIPSQ